MMSDVESVNEADNESSQKWCTRPDGTHKHQDTNANLAIVSGAYTIGKTDKSNEDAFFISERSFGIADGVSGWADMGFSSQAFSQQLMKYCQQEIEHFDENRRQKDEVKTASNLMRKNRSFLSFDMLDDDQPAAQPPPSTNQGKSNGQDDD